MDSKLIFNPHIQPENTFIHKRIYPEEKMSIFKNKLSAIDWEPVYSCVGANEKYNCFLNILDGLQNQFFPMEKIKINIKHQNKPWITASVLKSIKKKNSLYKRMRGNKTNDLETKYKIYKNKLTTVIRAAEKQYYANKLLEMKICISKTWKLLNQMACRSITSNRITEIEVNGTSVSNPQEISEKFNHFFSNIGADLAKTIPRGNKKPLEFLTGDYSNSMFFNPILENKIHDIIANLKNSTSKGHDNCQCQYWNHVKLSYAQY